MKTLAVAASLLFLASIGQAQTLTASQAKAHEGENATVCGKVSFALTAHSNPHKGANRFREQFPSTRRERLRRAESPRHLRVSAWLLTEDTAPGEVGMNLEAVLVTDHQQRRIFQVFPVLFKLEISGEEVFVFALVLPGEVAALPYIGKALAAFSGGDVFLKGVGIPGLIGGGGVRLV
jgi:hypothetical protein